jgi:glycosyltransferase 2 family protein
MPIIDQENNSSKSVAKTEGSTAGNRLWRIFKKYIPWIIAVVCLIWVFHDIHIEQLIGQIAAIHWQWIALAVFCDIISYYCQGWRWRLILGSVGKIKSIKTTQAIYAGLFTNEILPLRIGEMVRTYLVSRWLSAPFYSIIPSLAIERLFDGIWLGIGIGLTALFVHLPQNLTNAVEILGVIVLVSTAIFIFLILHKEKTIDKKSFSKIANQKRRKTIGSFLGDMARGIREIGTSRNFYQAFVVSSLVLIFQILAFWLVMVGYGLPILLWEGAAAMMIVHLGTAIPNAPSNIGTYQFFTVIGVTLFGVDKTAATGFSVVVFMVLTLPLWLIGLFAISRTGMKLKDIRNDLSIMMKRNK